jgi:hypothetical protein
MTKTVYQTLGNRNNPKEIEDNAPFICDNSKAWLGDGYYFWDTFINNARWWGEISYQNDYIVCQSVCDDLDERCFDLVGNTNHLNLLRLTIDEMKQKNLLTGIPTLRRVINHLRFKVKISNIEAVRVLGENVRGLNLELPRYILLQINKNNKNFKQRYLDLEPPIQICFFTKKSMGLQKCKIVYPPQYTSEFVV